MAKGQLENTGDLLAIQENNCSFYDENSSVSLSSYKTKRRRLDLCTVLQLGQLGVCSGFSFTSARQRKIQIAPSRCFCMHQLTSNPFGKLPLQGTSTKPFLQCASRSGLLCRNYVVLTNFLRASNFRRIVGEISLSVQPLRLCLRMVEIFTEGSCNCC